MNNTISHLHTKLHFQRFEFKYLIDADTEARIKRRITPYLQVDPFARDLPGQQYEVVSLYYDSPGFYYYHEKIDGVQRRKKIRLRTYRNNNQFIAYGFFEIKRKFDAVILKDRFVLSLADYARLIQDEDFQETAVFHDQSAKPVIEEYEWERRRRSLAPKILVAYDREPYIGRLNKNFRVTFDKNIRAMENDNLFFTGNDLTDVSGNQTVMELKFTGTLPFYIKSVIEEFDLDRVAYSKYTNGVEACGSLHSMDSSISKGVRQVYASIRDETAVADHILAI